MFPNNSAQLAFKGFPGILATAGLTRSLRAERQQETGCQGQPSGQGDSPTPSGAQLYPVSLPTTPKQMLLPFVLRCTPRVRRRCNGNSIKQHLPGSWPSLLHALSSSLLLPGSLFQRKHLQIEPTPRQAFCLGESRISHNLEFSDILWSLEAGGAAMRVGGVGESQDRTEGQGSPEGIWFGFCLFLFIYFFKLTFLC